MLTLDGSIVDFAQEAWSAASGSASAQQAASSLSPTSSAGDSEALSSLFEIAKLKAEADKRRATWLLFAVGAGGLAVGTIVGRYFLPRRR